MMLICLLFVVGLSTVATQKPCCGPSQWEGKLSSSRGVHLPNGASQGKFVSFDRRSISSSDLVKRSRLLTIIHSTMMPNWLPWGVWSMTMTSEKSTFTSLKITRAMYCTLSIWINTIASKKTLNCPSCDVYRVGKNRFCFPIRFPLALWLLPYVMMLHHHYTVTHVLRIVSRHCNLY